MIKEAYCSFEVAKLLKEKGFNLPCRVLYSYIDEFNNDVCNRDVDWNSISPFGDISAPTHQMAMAWLREEKGIAIVPILSSVLDNEKFLWDIEITVAKTNESYYQAWIYESYEEAVERALKYSLENLI